MAVDADRQGPIEILVSDNRSVMLLTFFDCAVQPVDGVDGETYFFDLGFREIGTGVGCMDADGDGVRDLVQLLRESAGPQRVEWSRTIVQVDGTHAVEGPTDTGTFAEPGDHEAIEMLSTVSCGARTMDDALAEPRV